MQRRIGRGQIISLLLCVGANVLSIWGYVLWCTKTGLDYKEIMDRAFDLGWFGSLYLWSLFWLLIQMLKPEWAEKRMVLNFVMKHPIVLFYLFGILLKVLQGNHFVLPAAVDLLHYTNIEAETVFTLGFAIDCYFLVMCLIDVFFKKDALFMWNIGMAILNIVVLIFYIANGKMQTYICLEILASILWHMHFASVIRNSHNEINSITNSFYQNKGEENE